MKTARAKNEIVQEQKQLIDKQAQTISEQKHVIEKQKQQIELKVKNGHYTRESKNIEIEKLNKQLPNIAGELNGNDLNVLNESFFESLWVLISGLSVKKILFNASYCPKNLGNNFIDKLT